MKRLSTQFWDDGVTVDFKLPDLLVTNTRGLDIDEWFKEVEAINPRAVIPPYNILNPDHTTKCADMARMRLDNVGVVVAGRKEVERNEFFLWAQEQGYAPIVILPHARFTRQRQIMQLSVPKYINRDTWIHLPEPVWDFDETAWPGEYTTGEEFRSGK